MFNRPIFGLVLAERRSYSSQCLHAPCTLSLCNESLWGLQFFLGVLRWAMNSDGLVWFGYVQGSGPLAPAPPTTAAPASPKVRLHRPLRRLPRFGLVVWFGCEQGSGPQPTKPHLRLPHDGGSGLGPHAGPASLWAHSPTHALCVRPSVSDVCDRFRHKVSQL